MGTKRSFITKAKIAGTTTETQLSVNAGLEKGILVNDIVIINREVVIEDPDSKEKLGSVYYAKLKLKVIYVSAKFSIAQVTDTYMETWSAIKTPKLKTITLDPFSETEDCILISIGGEVTVSRDEEEAEPE